ncbi:RNA polymerase-associated protein RapA [bacterium]|nr:RNA polymerase-associated protein RapA [bacterium]
MSTTYWAIGQRVRSEAEPSLGLGIIESFPTSRSIQIAFPGAGERRIYNPANAPLRRFELGVGQSGQTQDGRTFRVERIEETEDGLLTYHGQGIVVPELQLADSSASRDPLQRLFAADFSAHEAFDLRKTGWHLRSEVLQQRCRGLTGARVSLLPHQLAIAYKVSSREYPRALLADEVGLGKTIEACLVYSALRALGRADRVLVLTPSSLVHQWLVELYRRFNELFTVAHAELIPAQGDGRRGQEAQAENPFADASRLIAPLDWLLEPGRLQQALEHPWDLVIVDEAHHLTWSREQASPGYQAVEALANNSQGLLLLTATPLRQGLETEFGLLRLVDPERFADFERFEAEHAHMREVADLARRLYLGEQVTDELRRMFPEARWDGTTAESLQQLIDRHGTGRVLIRNRREKLGGFPGRQLHLTRLPLPPSWQKADMWPEIAGLQRMLNLPVGKGEEPPAKDDPRVAWLLELIRELGKKKVVVMASSVATVKWLEKTVRHHSGLKVAVFHEQLGLVERDRQAAYFADPEGAQILISSEIGGEGRNFQFCHHLALFDLPLHPDALEQRIGRLDRIGQTETIQVHVALVEQTPGEALFQWHRTLRVFEAPLTGGEHLMAAQAQALLDLLRAHTPRHRDQAKLDAFLQETAALLAQHQADVQAGVDFLIDLNSCDQELGDALVGEVKAFDYPLLKEALSGLLEHFGVVEEDLADPLIQRIRPGDLMKVEPFPGLRSDGYLATYDRSLALAREDIQFLSPDHPLVEGALALLLDQSEGRASIAHWAGAPEQGVWIEFLFLLEAVGPGRLGLPRFLPPTSLSLTLDLRGKARPSPQAQEARLLPLSPSIWARMAGVLQDQVPALLETAEEMANAQLQSQVEAAVAQAARILGSEQQRLEELRGLGSVSAVELASHSEKAKETLRHLSAARVSLDAVRVVLLDPSSPG